MDFKGQLVLALALNIALKVLTFTLSTLLTRMLLPEQSGISFSYAVYVDSVLFISREAVRNTASRLGVYGRDPDTCGTSGTLKPAEESKQVSRAAARRLVSVGFLAVPIAMATVCLFEAAHGLLRVPLLPSLQQTAATAAFTLPEAAAGAANAARVRAFATPDAAARAGLPLSVAPLLPEVLVGLSIVLSAAVEPCVVVVQALDLYRVVVLAEFVSLTARLSTTMALVHRLAGTHGGGGAAPALSTPYEARLVFAIGQMAYAAAYAGYYAFVCSRWVGQRTSLARLACRVLGGSTALSAACRAAEEDGNEAEAASMGASARSCMSFPLSALSVRGVQTAAAAQRALLRPFLAESVLRLVLTEGEGFALSAMGSDAARGSYQLVSNLGSLVARLVFRVWENACFVRWSRDVAGAAYASALALLVLMLRLSLYVGLAFSVLGPPFAEVLLRSLFSRRWATAGTVRALRLYCYAVPALAWNGLLEAFLRAVATPAVLHQQQRVALLQSCLYVAACYAGLAVLTPGKEAEGAAGSGGAVCFLIVANHVSMLARIAYTLWVLVTKPMQPTESKDGEEQPVPFLSRSSLAAAIVWPHKAMTPALVLLFAGTRAVPPSLGTLVASAGVYAGVVLALDAEVRGMVLRVATPAFAKLSRKT